MEAKLELIPVPVSDVDRAKHFYGEQLGFAIDFDHQVTERMRLVQLTPPGSGCSIAVGTGVVDSAAGSLKGLQLVVTDIDAWRATLVANGVDVGPVVHYEGDDRVEGHGGDWNSFVHFSDPDGNGWILQQRPST
jgi:catechol 2,3-dioxygenase-like lactoylglutathione lyase family enzyme